MSIMVAITVFSISLSIIPAYAAEELHFDQTTIMLNHSDVITYTSSAGIAPTQVTISGGTDAPMPITLTQMPGSTTVWNKMVNFTTCSNNDLAALKYCVANGNQITITNNGGSDTAIISNVDAPATTGTPLTVSAIACPTDPDLFPDGDQDGICDVWEQGNNLVITNGSFNYTFPCSPVCNDSKKDVFVEVDFMTGHRPNQQAIDAVKTAFLNAPTLTSGTGFETGVTSGINLRIQIDDTETGINHSTGTDFIESGTTTNGFDQIKAAHFGTSTEKALPNWNTQIQQLKRQAFHYFLFAHSQLVKPTSSGIAEIWGNDGMVTLGPFDGQIGSPDQQAGTFMHELGHNLKLNHGGSDTINCKPNYLSVMSHSRQFNELIGGVSNSRTLDYSGLKIPSTSLAENSLSESTGTPIYTPRPNELMIWNTKSSGTPVLMTNKTGPGQNWNGDTTTGGTVSADLNNLGTFCTSASAAQNLVGFNDWTGINLKFQQSTTSFADGMSSSSSSPPRSGHCPTMPSELTNPLDIAANASEEALESALRNRQNAIDRFLIENRACPEDEITSDHVREIRHMRINQLKDIASPLEESNPYLYSDIIGKYEDAKNLINNDELALAHQKLSEIDYSGIEDATIKEQLQGASNDVKSLFSHVKPDVPSTPRGPGASPQEGPAPEDLQAPEEAPADNSGIMAMIAGAAAAAIGGGAYAVSRRGSGTKVNRQ